MRRKSIQNAYSDQDISFQSLLDSLFSSPSTDPRTDPRIIQPPKLIRRSQRIARASARSKRKKALRKIKSKELSPIAQVSERETPPTVPAEPKLKVQEVSAFDQNAAKEGKIDLDVTPSSEPSVSSDQTDSVTSQECQSIVSDASSLHLIPPQEFVYETPKKKSTIIQPSQQKDLCLLPPPPKEDIASEFQKLSVSPLPDAEHQQPNHPTPPKHHQMMNMTLKPIPKMKYIPTLTPPTVQSKLRVLNRLLMEGEGGTGEMFFKKEDVLVVGTEKEDTVRDCGSEDKMEADLGQAEAVIEQVGEVEKGESEDPK